MVRAILDGRKTQTRRVVKPSPSWCALDPYEYGGQKVDWQTMGWMHRYDGLNNGWWTAGLEKQKTGCYGHFRCPYGKPGDRLWVKETHSIQPCNCCVVYQADDDLLDAGEKWQSSIFTPRRFSRITLKITDIRVERLQKITDTGAIAEGVDQTNTSIPGYATTRFQNLWEKINGKKYPWVSNPWLWVIEFKKV